ncbi:MAG: AraC family transcriptional regulator [Clostridia bacterium]|nr:AraC family transcriptional regulator [Clostridia bacterium]
MKQLREIYTAIEYIEENLREPFNVGDVAQASGFSLFHFSRIFNALIGHSPYDYIMRRRLSEAFKELAGTERTITAVAFDYQFNNVETFSRAFKKMFGVLPHKIRNLKESDSFILKTPADYCYIEHINQCGFFSPRIVKLDSISMVGRMTQGNQRNPFMEETAWNSLRNDILSNIPGGNSDQFYAIVFQPAFWRNSTHSRLFGIDVQDLNIPPVSLMKKTIPAQTFVEFKHQGPLTSLGMTYDYICQTWLPKSGCGPDVVFSLEKCSNIDCYMNISVSILIPVQSSA